MEQCRGGCSHEMVKSPATATTMAYPTEEEKRSHRRIGGINGDDDDNDDDDDVVRGNGKHEARDRDLVICRVCDVKSDRGRDNDLESYLNDYDNGSKIGATDTSNSDFTCSCQLPSMLEATHRLSESSSSQDESERRQNGKENHGKMRRSRKQSQPRQVIWHRDHRKRYLIPALGMQNVRNKKFKINSKSVQQKATSRMFKCHLCPKYAPARGKTHRPYHSRASLTLHMLWRHKRGSWPAKNRAMKDSLASTISSVTLKATFFTNPNYRYDR